MPPYDKRPPAERFWSFVRKSAGCWEWQGSGNGVGYGHFYIVRRMRVYAHRYSVLLSGRNIGSGQQVLHSCDNPRCVRPDHLVVGTTSDNMRDAYRKGRNPGNRYGERTHCKHGHPFGDSPPLRRDGARRCLKCESVHWTKSNKKRQVLKERAA